MRRRAVGSEVDGDLPAAYARLAAEEEREREAVEWSEGLIGDVGDADDK